MDPRARRLGAAANDRRARAIRTGADAPGRVFVKVSSHLGIRCNLVYGRSSQHGVFSSCEQNRPQLRAQTYCVGARAKSAHAMLTGPVVARETVVSSFHLEIGVRGRWGQTRAVEDWLLSKVRMS